MTARLPSQYPTNPLLSRYQRVSIPQIHMTSIFLPFEFLTSTRIPPELVLKTVQYLPFEDGKKLAAIRCANPRIGDLIATYEHSITIGFMRKELRHAMADFPCTRGANLAWLARCVARYDVVDAIMDELTWRENCVAVEPHNVALVNAGLLVLFRLVDISKSRLQVRVRTQSVSFNPLYPLKPPNSDLSDYSQKATTQNLTSSNPSSSTP